MSNGPKRPSRQLRQIKALHRDLGAALELLRTGKIEDATGCLQAAREQLARIPGVVTEKKETP